MYASTMTLTVLDTWNVYASTMTLTGKKPWHVASSMQQKHDSMSIAWRYLVGIGVRRMPFPWFAADDKTKEKATKLVWGTCLHFGSQCSQQQRR